MTHMLLLNCALKLVEEIILYPFLYKVYRNILVELWLETCLFPCVPRNFEIKDHRIYALKNSPSCRRTITSTTVTKLGSVPYRLEARNAR